jgi:tRNA(Ile)-lysidine synthase
LEAAAREARYRLLSTELQPGEILLTAHHSDDQLETVLLQLLRGSGLPGIAAMPALAPFARGLLARPLLSRSRAELEQWVQQQKLTWIEDDSNADESLDRNYHRLRVLPLIRDRWPGSATAVSRSARHVAEAQALLDTLARADINRASYGESLSIKSLRALPPDRLRNALRFWITRAGYLAPDTKRLNEITGPVLDARPDANPFVEWGEGEGSARAQRHGDLLSLGPSVSPAPSAELVWSWRDSPVHDLPHDLGKLELEPDDRGPVDLDALPHPLTIRWRRGGERLSPRRGGPRRALKNLLQESHVPVNERQRLPLLFSAAPAGATSSSDRLLAVADLLLDETVQATPTSRRRARLRWKKSSHGST